MAADNESRRTEQDQNVIAPDTERSSIVYKPLDSKVDCTRFVEIESAVDDEANISCKHVHIPFGKRPKFVALSYVWGEGTARETILLNGAEFAVSKNLLSALRHLRRKVCNDRLFWIDAICINQQDPEEKTRQVRIMGHIYERASSVIVWLGEGYSKYQPALTSIDKENQARKWETSPSIGYIESLKLAIGGVPSKRMVMTIDTGGEVVMVNSLALDEYWNRLWIIQELGRAQTLRVCFGDWEWPRQNFINFLTHHNVGQVGPLRLNRQLRQPPNGCHFLCQLLRDHGQAKCKDRKDKIYGLLGLAADAIGIPIDYAKSPIEIWIDTMQCLNQQEHFTQADYMPLGRLVKKLLMGDDFEPLERVSRTVPQTYVDAMSLTVGKYDETRNAKVFTIKAYALGYICNLGPSVQAIVENPRSVDLWRRNLHSSFRNDLGPATEESNALLKGILQSSDEKLADLCLGHVSNVKWTFPWRVPWQHKQKILCAHESQKSPLNSSHGSSNADGSGAHLLFQMITFKEDLPWRMGIVPAQSQQGDVICWISEIENAILVRLSDGKSGEFELLAQVFGTAVVSEDVVGASFDHQDRFIKASQMDSYVKISLDAWTLFALLVQ
ncbi:hypothetical protein Daus18300_002296 [Diaporthe australafricana]|uniref:Heterokaryon incompatibility domain-containing protein n=1 Tax=Diaporthe australafricana TaxID=127596 RepID=A0ABR3XQS9_9PEZI